MLARPGGVTVASEIFLFGEIACISIPPRGCWVRAGWNTPWDGSVIERGVKGRDEGGGVEGEG